MVGTSNDGHPFWVVVADRETLTPEVVLPANDVEGNYSNGGLSILALTDDGTVLLRVIRLGRGIDGFHVVAWDPESGELSTVSSTALGVSATVAFAEDLLRR